MHVPLVHVLPPQPAQVPVAVHRSPAAHDEPVMMHWPAAALQHAPVQVVPLQQGCPAAPHAAHRPPEQVKPDPVQVLPAQQA